ncbi:Kelch motif [Musa troglodytarum]|uniref:Kelch motif n=1 Tax=Musa troglodytarum TaxID=320322 RepID=A0A9E7HQI3_9LILI|nr:Kelch motif [Musa troglodytarum]
MHNIGLLERSSNLSEDPTEFSCPYSVKVNLKPLLLGGRKQSNPQFETEKDISWAYPVTEGSREGSEENRRMIHIVSRTSKVRGGDENKQRPSLVVPSTPKDH